MLRAPRELRDSNVIAHSCCTGNKTVYVSVMPLFISRRNQQGRYRLPVWSGGRAPAYPVPRLRRSIAGSLLLSLRFYIANYLLSMHSRFQIHERNYAFTDLLLPAVLSFLLSCIRRIAVKGAKPNKRRIRTRPLPLLKGTEGLGQKRD